MRTARSPSRTPASGPFEGQAAAEADYLRMCQLRRMSYGELRTLLAGDPAQAAPWIEVAARYDLVEAQVRLGQMHLDGLGAAKDDFAALNWFLRAANKGSPEAMNMVGRCHENGWGTPISLPTAARWYLRSAEAGHDWGEYNYANMLFDGRGVERDEAEAAVWYRRASGQGHARAMNLLARCHEEGWGVARDTAAACAWYHRSAEAGYFRAQFNYGSVLAAHGRIDEAMPWFRKACQDAPADSLRSMIEALSRQSDQRLVDFAGSFSQKPSEGPVTNDQAVVEA
jgi:TPR repeat protein